MAIGESIFRAVRLVVIDRLASEEVINLFKSWKIDPNLVNMMKSLMLAAQKLLAEAEEKQITDVTVKEWLSDLKHQLYRAEEIADEIATEALRSSMDPSPKSFGSKVRNLIPSFSSSSSFAATVNSEMSEVVTQLEYMVRHPVDLNLRDGCVNVNTRVTTSYFQQDDKVFGRVKEKEQLLKFLSSHESNRIIGVVAIVGMGGMGKSTLAKLAYNHHQSSFDLKAWVYVSEKLDISRVIRSILETITGKTYCGPLQLESLNRELRGELKEKRFLLVLDDVWKEEPEEWEHLWTALAVSAHGSKIIVTTRNSKVASVLRASPVIPLKTLSDEDGWSLFSKHAFATEDLQSHNPHMESIGREIVNKCQGLPLAIKTLASLLRSTKGIDEWRQILNSTLWGLLDSKTNVAPALRLSYHYLPSHLKRCFSYCAIFPKGYEFDRQELVLLWMAENFLEPSDSGQRLEDTGEDYLEHLLSCSFFDRSGDRVVMHDLMHGLAEAVSGCFLARLGHEEDQESRISEKARYFSFSEDSFQTSSKFEGLLKAKYLRAFVRLQGPGAESSFYLRNEIHQFNCLHVLSLSGYDLFELPESIGSLKQLRYLNVSGTPIKELPESVTTLCNLQSLLLSRCTRLERLPAEMSRLVSLRHLDITETTSLRQMPKDMCKLKCLQTLTSFVVGKHCGQGIEELRELDSSNTSSCPSVGSLSNPELHSSITPEDGNQIEDGNKVEDVNKNDDLIKNEESEKECNRKRSNNNSRFPVRPDAEDCSFYMRTGACKFGMNCKFKHPPNHKKSQGVKVKAKEEGGDSAAVKEKDEAPKCNKGKKSNKSVKGVKVKAKEEGGDSAAVKEKDEAVDKEKIDCKYFDRPGGRKFGKACKFNHSRKISPTIKLNFMGLPIRAGEKECPFYMRNGSCKNGANCRFNHPDPTTIGVADSLPRYANGGSIFPPNDSQSTLAPWSPPTLSESAPYVPLVFSPAQGVPPQPEWNTYQAPVYPPERSVHMPPTYALNNGSLERPVQMRVDEFPERPGQPECSYFLKTGNCKYKSACKFHHPKSAMAQSPSCHFSDSSLPLRPGEDVCSHYYRYGICKYGPACKYDHPKKHAHSSELTVSAVDQTPVLGNSMVNKTMAAGT